MQNTVVKFPPPPPFPESEKEVKVVVHVSENDVVLDLDSKKNSKYKKKPKGLAGLFRKKEKYPKIIRKFNGRNIELRDNIFIIGRRKENALVIEDNPNISIMHAIITRVSDGYFLEDADSTNGTSLNGVDLKAFEKYPLKHKDKFTLGNEEFEFKLK
jgi:hypothetical protein